MSCFLLCRKSINQNVNQQRNQKVLYNGKQVHDETSPIMMDRRSHINTILSNVVTITTNTFMKPQMTLPQISINELAASLDASGMVTLPLEQCSGGGLLVRLIVKGITSSSTEIESLKVIRTIVDTASPYVVIPEDDDNNEVCKMVIFLME